VVELDLHPHGRELQAHIGEVTGRKTVPNVHILSISRGGGDEFRALQAEGTVISQLKEWTGNKVMIEKNV
jgi:glutaredoxin